MSLAHRLIGVLVQLNCTRTSAAAAAERERCTSRLGNRPLRRISLNGSTQKASKRSREGVAGDTATGIPRRRVNRVPSGAPYRATYVNEKVDNIWIDNGEIMTNAINVDDSRAQSRLAAVRCPVQRQLRRKQVSQTHR